jgi:hypothetical protein
VIGAVLVAMAAIQAAVPTGPPASTAPRRQTVFVSWDAQVKACVPQVDGVETGPVSTDEGKAALVAALHDKGAFIRLIGRNGYSIPYDCAADIAAVLKHSGFYGGMGLVSGPAS